MRITEPLELFYTEYMLILLVLGKTEIAGREEEHHQLPPYENVPKGRWAPEEGWQAWLNEFFLLDWHAWIYNDDSWLSG